MYIVAHSRSNRKMNENKNLTGTNKFQANLDNFFQDLTKSDG